MVADSELAANDVLAAAMTRLGRPTTVEHSLARYMGRRWIDCLPLVTEDLGFAPPEGFKAACDTELRSRLEARLQPVPGVVEFLARFGAVPRCVASSSSPAWLADGLARMGLADRFGAHVFSAQQVKRGKPAPDLFLFAAAEMGVAPRRALVIEDSLPGVMAGRAAGAAVAGLCAGLHIRPGHAERLTEAGAQVIATSYADLGDWIDARG